MGNSLSSGNKLYYQRSSSCPVRSVQMDSDSAPALPGAQFLLYCSKPPADPLGSSVRDGSAVHKGHCGSTVQGQGTASPELQYRLTATQCHGSPGTCCCGTDPAPPFQRGL